MRVDRRVPKFGTESLAGDPSKNGEAMTCLGHARVSTDKLWSYRDYGGAARRGGSRRNAHAEQGTRGSIRYANVRLQSAFAVGFEEKR